MPRAYVSVPLLLLATLITHGLALGLVLLVPPALDGIHAVRRDRRYKYVPWSLTRRLWRFLFVTPRRPVPIPPRAPVPPRAPDAPLGDRNSRAIPQGVKVAVAARDQGRCRTCGSADDLQFDHVVPWSRGGANTVANVQLLCGTCNRAKAARMPATHSNDTGTLR